MNSKYKYCYVFVDKEFINGVRKALKKSIVDVVPATLGKREGQLVLLPTDDEIDRLVAWGRGCKSTEVDLLGKNNTIIKGTTISVPSIALKKKGVKTYVD